MPRTPKRNARRASFHRPSPQTRTLVQRRHARQKAGRSVRWQRQVRRLQHRANEWGRMLRKWFVLGLVALFVGLLGYFFLSPTFHVRSIRVQRMDLRLDVVKVQRALAPLFGRHLLLLSDREVDELVRRAIPDAQTVTLQKQYPNRIAVRITQVPLIARLQVERPQQAGTGSQVSATAQPEFEYLAENGFYVQTPAMESGAQLPLLTVRDIASEPAPGTPLIHPDLLKAMTQAETQLQQEFGATVTSRVVLVRGREFHLTVRRPNAGSVTLWFDLSLPLTDEFGRFRLFLQSPVASAAKQYIDLRLPGEVVYR